MSPMQSPCGIIFPPLFSEVIFLIYRLSLLIKHIHFVKYTLKSSNLTPSWFSSPYSCRAFVRSLTMYSNGVKSLVLGTPLGTVANSVTLLRVIRYFLPVLPPTSTLFLLRRCPAFHSQYIQDARACRQSSKRYARVRVSDEPTVGALFYGFFIRRGREFA